MFGPARARTRKAICTLEDPRAVRARFDCAVRHRARAGRGMSEPAIRSLPVRAPTPDAERWLEALPAPVHRHRRGRARPLRRTRLPRNCLLALGADCLAAGSTKFSAQTRRSSALARRALSGRGAASRKRMWRSSARASRSDAPRWPPRRSASTATSRSCSRSRRAPRAPSTAGVNTAARTLAHEVRNPLAGIRAAAQLIARSDDPDIGRARQAHLR